MPVMRYRPKDIVLQCYHRLERALEVWDSFDQEWLGHELALIGEGLLAAARQLATKKKGAEGR